MDTIETMVNQNCDNKRMAARKRRLRAHAKRVCVAIVVAVAFLLFAVTGLAHPVLSTVIMICSLMIGCYHLGRCVRFGKRVR